MIPNPESAKPADWDDEEVGIHADGCMCSSFAIILY